VTRRVSGVTSRPSGVTLTSNPPLLSAAKCLRADGLIALRASPVIVVRRIA
jgi:hypothetical protein